MRYRPRCSSESGNIFIYILGAIFLMGLLIIVVRGSDPSGSNIDGERMMILTSDVQQYGSELEQAITAIIRQGHSEGGIRFALPGTTGPDSIEDQPDRQVFARNGGAAAVRKPPPAVTPSGAQWIFSSDLIVGGVGTTCAAPSSACADLAALLRVNRAFCRQLNISAGVTNPADEPPVASTTFTTVTDFDGSYTGTIELTDAGSHLRGHREGCVQADDGVYFYYRVLLSR